jgi:hypothetical protein
LVDVQAQPHIRVLPRHHVLPGVRVRSIKPVKDWCGTACGSLFLEFTTKGSVQYVLEFGNKNGNATWKTLQFPFLRRSCQARRLAMKETHEFRVLVELNGPPATRAWVMNKTLVNAAQVCRDRNAVRNPVLQPLIIKVVPSKAVRPCRWDFGSPCRCQSYQPPTSEPNFFPLLTGAMRFIITFQDCSPTSDECHRMGPCPASQSHLCTQIPQLPKYIFQNTCRVVRRRPA